MQQLWGGHMISRSIKEYIDSNVDNCNNDLELAYTIYILLGKVLYYSPLYVKYKLDNLIPSINSVSLDNPYVNCNTWSRLYNELLLEYGIDSKVIGDKHKLVEFNTNKYKVRADATIYIPDDIFDVSSDLTNIKYGLDILYFKLINNEYRDDFNKNIDNVNTRFNISKGNDAKILKEIKQNIDGDKANIKYGIDFYNSFYEMCDGEVERRQLFERYYPLLFGNVDNDLIDIYDNAILSKHLIIYKDNYFLETNDGFINLDYEEIMNLIISQKIKIRYRSSINKIYKKTLF